MSTAHTSPITYSRPGEKQARDNEAKPDRVTELDAALAHAQQRRAEEAAQERAKQNRAFIDKHTRNAHWLAAQIADELADQAADRCQSYLAEEGATTPAERAKCRNQALTAHQRAHQFRDMANEFRQVAVKYEPPPYSSGSSHSWFADLAAATGPATTEGRTDALWRLERHGRDLASQALDRRSYAYRALRDVARKDSSLRTQSEDEFRAMTSASGSGGAFVPPAYLNEQYAVWRSFIPAVAEACTPVDLPAYGMEVLVPAVTSAPTVTAQSSENTDPTSGAGTSFSSAYRTVAVATFSAYVEASQQLIDRSGPGISFDQVVYAQLREQLDAQVDSAVIAAMMSGATTNITNNDGPSSGNAIPVLWFAVNQAAASLEATPGTALPATHAFIPSALLRYLQAQLDGSVRPIWTPSGDAAPDPTTGFSGYRIGSTGVFTDDNLPVQSGNATVLVANPGSTLLLRGEPIVQVLPQVNGFSSELTALVRMYQYVATVVRYPAGAATITGSTFPASPSFTATYYPGDS